MIVINHVKLQNAPTARKQNVTNCSISRRGTPPASIKVLVKRHAFTSGSGEKKKHLSHGWVDTPLPPSPNPN
jgi:hypothetical protein